MTDTARIIASYRAPLIVRTPDGKTYEASTRKKRVDLPAATACISKPSTPNSRHRRLPAARKPALPPRRLENQLIAANVSQLPYRYRCRPSPSEALLQRASLPPKLPASKPSSS